MRHQTRFNFAAALVVAILLAAAPPVAAEVHASPSGSTTLAAGTGTAYGVPANSIACQRITVPSGGLTLTQVTFYTSGTPTATEWLVALYNADGTRLTYSATRGNFSSNAQQTATLNAFTASGVANLLVAGSYDVCLSVGGTGSLQLATSSSASASHMVQKALTTAPDAPTTLGTPYDSGFPSTTNAAWSIFVRGEQYSVSSFPYYQTFDNWTTCVPQCILATPSFGPCNLFDGWTNLETGDDFDWIINSGSTPTENTGPDDDISRGGNYLYTESSEPCHIRKSAVLQSPPIVIPQHWIGTMRFAYHMYGGSGYNFSVDASSDAGQTWAKGYYYIDPSTNVNQWEWASISLEPFSGKTIMFRFNVTTSAFTSSNAGYLADIAVDNFIIEAYTRTQTPIPTTTPTPSTTITPTPTETETTTRSATATQTTTETSTQFRDYIYLGIPDPDPLHQHATGEQMVEGIVDPRWSSVSPLAAVQNEAILYTFSGNWMYTLDASDSAEQVWAKVALWHVNCFGMADGTTAQLLNARKQVQFTIAKPGTYRICIKHRKDWEEVRNGIVTVLPPQANVTFWNFASCAGAAKAFPSICGCYVQRGPLQNARQFTAEMDLPFRTLMQGSSALLIEQGCCRRGSTQRTAFNSSSVAWGFCGDKLPILPPDSVAV